MGPPHIGHITTCRTSRHSTELITNMPNFSIVGKGLLCRMVIYRNKRTEVVGVLEPLADAYVAWCRHGFPGHPSELASQKCLSLQCRKLFATGQTQQPATIDSVTTHAFAWHSQHNTYPLGCPGVMMEFWRTFLSKA